MIAENKSLENPEIHAYFQMVSGKQMTPGGATELMEVLGREESVARIQAAIARLEKEL